MCINAMIHLFFFIIKVKFEVGNNSVACKMCSSPLISGGQDDFEQRSDNPQINVDAQGESEAFSLGRRRRMNSDDEESYTDSRSSQRRRMESGASAAVARNITGRGHSKRSRTGKTKSRKRSTNKKKPSRRQ
jgi:hypothetical protein